ncbi:methyltransferase domain-containing protein [Natronincola ferrireducens]|uniref:Methyltransferase domain-containing protein n=1 Tax=Natronincola ferrireducens TaxID=393762 RepID=A0A1G9GKF6_9FIRM|nr:methyltransferase domain-containing protein [Natronincola ferrireducens]SDL01159.1 Methyltransferase domain-containing protein [Natronincola ferrireducens]
MIKKEIFFGNEAWAEALTSAPYFKMRIRSEEEIKDYWNKVADKYDSNMMGQEEDRVGKVMNYLIKSKMITSDTNVLDLGSGTGAYTIPMAKIANAVTALDSSSEMCSILKEKARINNLKNIAVLTKPWEEVNLKKENLHKNFDLVFSSLNPGIRNLKTLVKMNAASRKYCCLISTSGRVEDNTRREVGRLLLGKELDSKRANDVIYPFYILYNLGYSPQMEYINITFSREKKREEAITSLCDSFWLYTDITPDVRKKIADFVDSKIENGLFKTETKMKLGMVYWSVEG